MINIKQFEFNPFGENCYVVSGASSEGVVVDPGFYTEEERLALYNYVQSRGITLKGVLLTHAHPDHIWGAARLQRDFDIAVYLHGDDVELLADCNLPQVLFGGQSPDTGMEITHIKDGDVLSTEDLSFKVIHTPGHTPGGVCFYEEQENVLFTGDTLFAGTIGRTDLKGGSYDKLIVSIMETVMPLDGDAEVLPGHGPTSNIGWERTHNPFLEPWGEAEEFDPDLEGISISIDG